METLWTGLDFVNGFSAFTDMMTWFSSLAHEWGGLH